MDNFAKEMFYFMLETIIHLKLEEMDEMRINSKPAYRLIHNIFVENLFFSTINQVLINVFSDLD